MWQTLQWPKPCTRYAPRCRCASAALCVAGCGSADGKYKRRQICKATWVLKGQRKAWGGGTASTGSKPLKNTYSASLSARVMWRKLVYGNAGLSQRPSRDCPWCMARQKSSALQRAKPLAAGVRLLLYTVPNGVGMPSPPENGGAPGRVWQPWQLPKTAR